MEYQGYSFRNGLLVMLANVIFWGILGIYLDQVIPSQFGIAKPWNFCCKCNKKRASLVSEQEK
jgi:ATP-binding cassette subfamily A (ABC1) protein 3